MQSRLVLTLVAAATVAAAWLSPAHADPKDLNYSVVPTDLYISPRSEGISTIPSGNINLVPGLEGETTAVSKDPAAVPADTTNLLGCTGVGQGEYTSGVYNMPESFGKFQQDVDSLLSRQLLVMNYSLPQTAALFDQLNNYGNQRFASFQQGCSVDALKQDAKNQYLNACVAKLTPERKNVITSVMTGNTTPKEPLLSSMAYAQAWEICTNQYVSDTTAVAMRKDMNQRFAERVRDLENVTEAIKPLLCNATSKNTVNGGTPDPNGSDIGCWQTLLIPQVRLCLDDTLGCDDEKGYTVNEPLLAMPRLFDTLRFIMDDLVITRNVNDLNKQIVKNNVNSAVQMDAANEAVLSLSNATLGRLSKSGAPAGTATDLGESTFGSSINGTQSLPDESVKDYMINYLNCKDMDILAPLKYYVDRLNRSLSKGKNGQAETIKLSPDLDTTKIIEALKLTDAEANQIEALKALARVSLACTSNQTVPIFDPIITASLQTECRAPDRYAFYSMAGYDVALSSTRDIYRYLNTRLKQAYARLLTQSQVPQKADTTAAPGGNQEQPLTSPELNARLAKVVKEVMIPQVEAQLSRLEELNNTRGQFAQRVQQIYAKKTGCIYEQKNWGRTNPVTDLN